LKWLQRKGMSKVLKCKWYVTDFYMLILNDKFWGIEKIIWIFCFAITCIWNMKQWNVKKKWPQYSTYCKWWEDPELFYEWKSYLQEFVKPLKHITDYCHFFIDSKHPVVAKCKESASSDQFTFNLLKPKLDFHNHKPFPIFQP
jgi:hypothetical protein